jgi:hypothetical protein
MAAIEIDNHPPSPPETIVGDIITKFDAEAVSRRYEGTIEHSLGAPQVYDNPRLNPKNFLDGPLSWNPSTRLRQMLARPGIVVRICQYRLS